MDSLSLSFYRKYPDIQLYERAALEEQELPRPPVGEQVTLSAQGQLELRHSKG